MTGYNKFYEELCSYLEVSAISAERFTVQDCNLSFDLLTFENRPFTGVNSVITNGVAALMMDGDELVFSFDPNTLVGGVDINAFIATYLQLYYSNNKNDVRVGSYFSAQMSILNGYQFTGIYTSKPVYFPEEFLEKNLSVNLLWLIPIYESEIEYLNALGSHKFESLIERLDADLTKLNREPIV